MKYSTRAQGGILGACCVLGFFLIASVAFAQDHVVAIGKVNSNGTLANSANTVAGGVASVKNGTGDYTVTITAVNAFAGTAVSDYVAEVTCEDSSSDDQVPKIEIDSVTASVLTLDVHTDDVEDSVVNPDLALAFDNAFFFSVYRIPSSFPATGSTKYLLATGKVSGAAGGALLSGAGVDGITVGSSLLGEGNFRVTLTKTGAFAGAAADDFVIQLSINGASTADDAIRGDVTNITNDTLTVTVRTDDVQVTPDSSSPTPQSRTFHFTIYRIPPGVGAGLAKSKLLVAMGRVSTLGAFENGGVFEGGAINSVQNSTGDYTVTITSPGAFAGKTDNQFVLQVHQNHGFSADEVILGDIDIPDANTLTLDVVTNDAETSGQGLGVPDNQAFFFMIYDAAPYFRPDLRIGTKRNLTRHIGDNKYNLTGASQKVRVGLPGTQKKKYFLSLENDGNLSDDISLKAKRSGNKIKSKYFRLTAGRKNVTAAMTSAGFLVDDIPPCKIIKFEAQAKYKRPNKRPRKTLRFLARSQFLVSQRDVNKATLRRR